MSNFLTWISKKQPRCRLRSTRYLWLVTDWQLTFSIGLVRTLVGEMQKHRSDGVRVGIVIRSVELYVLGKTEFWFRLRLRRLRSRETWVVGVANRSGRTKPITKRGNVTWNWFILPPLFPTRTIWFSPDDKKWFFSLRFRLVLMTPLTTASFDFHKVISPLATLLTTVTPTPSLVKTSLYVTPLTIPTPTPSRVKTSLWKVFPFPFIFLSISSPPPLPPFFFAR